MSSRKKVIPTGGLTKKISDHAQSKYPEKDSPIIQPETVLIGVEGTKLLDGEKMFDHINVYNEKVTELDPLYASLTPVRGVIVRMRHIAMVFEGGLYRHPKVEIIVGSKSGHFILEPREAKYQMQNVGVIVAVNPAFKGSFRPGDLVQVDRQAVTPVKRSDNHPEELPNGFLHHSYTLDLNPPSTCTDRHFGYLLLKDPMSQIDVIVERKEQNEPDEKLA